MYSVLLQQLQLRHTQSTLKHSLIFLTDTMGSYRDVLMVRSHLYPTWKALLRQLWEHLIEPRSTLRFTNAQLLAGKPDAFLSKGYTLRISSKNGFAPSPFGQQIHQNWNEPFWAPLNRISPDTKGSQPWGRLALCFFRNGNPSRPGVVLWACHSSIWEVDRRITSSRLLLAKYSIQGQPGLCETWGPTRQQAELARWLTK